MANQPPAGVVFQFPVLTADARLGIAVANDTNAPAECTVRLRNPQRMHLGEAPVSVPAKSNAAQFLNELIPVPGGFTEGSATLSCDQPVAVIGLQFDGTLFTTLPAAVLSTTLVSSTPRRSSGARLGDTDPCGYQS